MKPCECGCGELAPIAQKNDAARGYVKGQPKRFVLGHARWKTTPEWEADEDTGCWQWLRFINGGGYGYKGFVSDDGVLTTTPAHRYVWKKLGKDLADDHDLHHLCRNRACVNPDHLEPVPWLEHRREHRIKANKERAHAHA